MNKTWELVKVIIVMILVLALTALSGFIVTALGINLEGPGAGIYILLASQIIFALSAIFLIKRNNKKTQGEFISNQGFKSDSWKMIIMGLGVAAFGNILISLLINLLQDSPLVTQSLDMVAAATTPSSPLEIFLMVIVVAVMAPIVEEFLFRGYFFEKTNKIVPLAAAVILNGLMFALFHMNFLQGVNTFFLGMFLTLIYFYRRNITDAILVHFANNAITVFNQFFPQYTPVVGIIMIICTFIGIFLFFRIVKEGKERITTKGHRENHFDKVIEEKTYE